MTEVVTPGIDLGADTHSDTQTRQRWMRVLAGASTAELAAAWLSWEPKPLLQQIRGPESGIVMVRGRIDAGGTRFNLGEATATRSTVRLSGAGLDQDVLGSSYVLGSDPEHARLAAIFDGILMAPALRQRMLAEVIGPLEQAQSQRDEQRHAEARSTAVDFFTVAREHE